MTRSSGLKLMRKRVKHVHPLVASTALEIVMESYDALMHHNEHYRIFKEGCEKVLGHQPNSKELEQLYLERNWGKGVEAARATLAQMLASGVSPGLDSEAKERIHEALVLDNSLQMGRKGQDQFARARKEILQ